MTGRTVYRRLRAALSRQPVKDARLAEAAALLLTARLLTPEEAGKIRALLPPARPDGERMTAPRFDVAALWADLAPGWRHSDGRPFTDTERAMAESATPAEVALGAAACQAAADRASAAARPDGDAR